MGGQAPNQFDPQDEGAELAALVENDEYEGAVVLGTVINYLESRGCRRRGRMGPAGFDMLGPDGRVMIPGFDPRLATEDLRERARNLLAVFREFRWP